MMFFSLRNFPADFAVIPSFTSKLRTVRESESVHGEFTADLKYLKIPKQIPANVIKIKTGTTIFFIKNPLSMIILD